MKHLEPKVTNKSSFSILLLRDDSSVVRFRLKPFWVKFLVLFLALFSVSSGMAGYSAHYYWKKYNALQRKQSILDAQLGENRRKLDEFAGIERAEAVLPRSSMTSVSVAAANGNGGKHGGTNGEGAAASDTAGANAETQKNEPSSLPEGAKPPPGEFSTRGPAVAPPANGPGAQTSSSAAQQSAPHAAAEPSEKKEHPALIDEIQIRHAGERRYALSFGLSNRDKQIRLNGRVHVGVADKSGARHEVSQINRDTLRFVINNYKRVVTSFSLPSGMASENAAQLLLTVTAEDVPDITYTFMMPASSNPAERDGTVSGPEEETPSASRS